MKLYDKERGITALFKEFERIDKFYHSFVDALYQDILLSEEFDEVWLDKFVSVKREFEILALEIGRMVSTLIDKDTSYPDYRLKDELDRMNKYFLKLGKKNSLQRTLLLPVVKNVIVNRFPQIVELSGNGFRLLEINLHLLSAEIVAVVNADHNE